jgi:hypothetical protein
VTDAVADLRTFARQFAPPRHGKPLVNRPWPTPGGAK